MAVTAGQSAALRAAVVNVSAPCYNLGAHKLADWLRDQGHTTSFLNGDPGLFLYGHDLVCLSVIFSWHVPGAAEIALRMRANAEVWCGGPGILALRGWWQQKTGLSPVVGLDQRFERQRGAYRMTFASRGCPVGCWFCLVPTLEGRVQQLDWDFLPAPILCDNNLSALPIPFQEHIIRRYRETDTILRDANSGFEPRTFDGGTYERWRGLLRGPWRFGYDELAETEPVERMLRVLAAETPKRKRVYVLIGNEPMAACWERVTRVVEWGGEPYCQPVLPLNWLGGTIPARHDWTDRRLRDFARYVNRFLWRSIPLTEYCNRQGEQPPFGGLLFGRVLPRRLGGFA